MPYPPLYECVNSQRRLHTSSPIVKLPEWAATPKSTVGPNPKKGGNNRWTPINADAEFELMDPLRSSAPSAPAAPQPSAPVVKETAAAYALHPHALFSSKTPHTPGPAIGPDAVARCRACAAAARPRREDRRDLIVLHLYGLYYEMGRQRAELLGPVAPRNNPSEREATHADIHQQTDGEHAGEQ